jgi:hypothetical protein
VPDSACSCKCETPNKKMMSKKTVSVEEEPGAYCAMVTTTTYEITYQCKDCGEQWTESKVESKFE